MTMVQLIFAPKIKQYTGDSSSFIILAVLNGNELWDVTRATLVSQQYASPAWWGYLKVDEKNRLQSIIRKAIRYRYLPRSFCTLGELSEDSDDKLFFSASTTQTTFSTASSPT